MTWFIISPRILECSAPSGGQVECAITYDMEEYGIHRSLKYCQFSLARPADGHEIPTIHVRDAALSRPLYDAFWRGFYMYLMNTLPVDMFSGTTEGVQPRRFYLSDVHFDPLKNCLMPSGVKVCRH